MVNATSDLKTGSLTELSAWLGATAGGAPRCDVQFRAHDGKLDVLVSSNGGRVWQTTILIP